MRRDAAIQTLADWVRLYFHGREQEDLLAAYFDPSGGLITVELLGRGGIAGVVACPRSLIRRGLGLQARSVILVHNHPSLETDPSPADLAMSRKLAGVLRCLALDLTAHYIVAGPEVRILTAADWGDPEPDTPMIEAGL